MGVQGDHPLDPSGNRPWRCGISSTRVGPRTDVPAPSGDGDTPMRREVVWVARGAGQSLTAWVQLAVTSVKGPDFSMPQFPHL